MATVETKLVTAEEFYEFVHQPQNRDRIFELERGEIIEMSRPGKFHGFVCANIVAILWLFAKQTKRGYVCSNDTEVLVEQSPDTVRGPDIMFFADADTAAAIEKRFGRTPPLLAVEVLSLHDTVGKVNRRVQEQLRFGTKLIWVVDPDARNVTVYQQGEQHVVVEENDELTGGDVLPGFHCKVAEFFELPAGVSVEE